MATIATPFATMEAKFATSMVLLVANAVLTLTSGTGAGEQMPSVYSQPTVTGLGDLRMQGREPSVLVRLADLPADVQQGSTVSVLYLGVTTPWRVQRRTDSPEAGDSLLDLELAS